MSYVRVPTLQSGNRWAELAAVLMDLDRCSHGRHFGDSCGGWQGPDDQDGGCKGGKSLGNPHLEEGQVMGYGIGGVSDPITFPGRIRKLMINEWRPRLKVLREE